MTTLISIVTVSFNAEECIEATLKSMENQGEGAWEYIVIDGNSSDGTLTILNSFKGIIDTLIVEHDKGIYDAMNKGLALAKGKFVYFLNAGDSFYSSNVLNKVAFIARQTQASIIFGDLKTCSKYIRTQQLSTSLYKGVPHQSCFFELEKIDCFDIKYPICADFKQYLQAKKEPGFSSFYVPLIIANYDSIKLDKSKKQRLQYDKQRTKEKMKICFFHLSSYNRIIGVGFYALHFIKYCLGLKSERNISED